ncbi:bifunctional methylenetetrahydrofolate dehydrogenase/methenyltetrahydrofolate cyclohydrolase FolD [uncultured Dubosiella sp.]|jgi:methylenetetrahydrofolate dehydrogenase (NADP+)/methenyltetrahydrofolate cyclohydrolase|uniref:bifunctional methylenetetrahydrofolate dehydrogenase/methenyltetrahydrofolate cyclohydrolase FolD n=1 Tax=uncultured Dubosiella sp. TaxID=1937011 RepID=UPI0020807C6C|nr:bifunctional methylenetetrahydrofolate dehydrogenase/methenyltetrahydrofolate cyclohydrolase FolD [uncultured Dubosiella sp.]GJM58545.1 bifunctional protein FolD [Erysipelotrichaceae bacterium OPF54]GJM58618.1 bifunctional protein FolD [Erysipelotrichaceae bacterium OPF54]GJM58691.1 bifunctional protein FolD [Erysipelotrichaceae bacterium OPF54]
MTVLYGNTLSQTLKEEMKKKIDKLGEEGKRIPMLAVILVGDNPASQSYVRSKEKACRSIGMQAAMIVMDKNVATEDVVRAVVKCNEDPDVDGILVQLPLPSHIDQQRVINTIDPRKDVDGLTISNAGRLVLGQKGLVPCTPKGIMAMLDSIGMSDLSGKRAVVIGRSILVGKPIALLLQERNATVTIIHSKTVDPEKIAHEADIVIAAIGVPRFITKGWIKEGAVVIDVGINRVDGKLVGDVDFDSVEQKVSWISPVPKGVGPMTVCMLLSNTLEAYERREKEYERKDRVRSE